MAYIDDNNNTIPAGAGKDPLKELDAELEELKISLGEMDSAAPSPAPMAQGSAPAYSAQPAPQSTAPVEVSAAQPQPAAQPAPQAPEPQKKNSPKTLILVLALALAFVGIGVGVVAYLLANSSPVNDDGTSKGGQSVTVNDSLLGPVEFTTVEGASVNTYDTDNLILGDNGLYEYYINGTKVSEIGVDLSEYQADVDFSAVKAAGVDFVILRVGGRYYSDEGGLYSDGAFKDYYQKAKAAGLKVGAYFFSQAASVADAEEEAKYTLELLGGVKLDYPVAFDWEIIQDDYARTDSVGGELLTEIAGTFCDRIRQGGYKPIVYTNASQMLQTYNFETMKDYDFWLADYREFPASDKMYYNFKMWQYATDGEIDGINAPVDLNLCLIASQI